MNTKKQIKKTEDKPRLTIENLEMELKQRGIEVKYNLITNEYEITPATHQDFDHLSARLHSDLGCDYTNATMATIAAYATYIGKENKYNPFLDYVSALVWDGKDRFEDLYTLMQIPKDDLLSRVLVHKFFLQTMALQYNSSAFPFGADGVLTFYGDQGAGKTALARAFALDKKWFLESGQIRDNDKDFERRLLSVVIGELGELDATFKRSDIARIKGFVTTEIDSYRLPYGRGDIKSPRHTSFVATVNDENFLVDTTGNRRFWSIPFKKIAYEDLVAFNFSQLWSQVYATVAPMTIEEKASCYRLTADERRRLDERNSKHEVPLKGEEEIRDILCEYSGEAGYCQSYQLATDFRKAFLDVLGRYDSRQIGRVLKKLGVSSKEGRGRRVTYLVPIKDTPPFGETK